MSLDDLRAEDILEVIQFFHFDDNSIIRSKALITKDYTQVIIGDSMSNIAGKDEDSTIDETNWLEKCVPWTGLERDLPLGVIGLPQGINVVDLVKSVTIFDDNTESGLAEIKPADIKAGMKLASAKMWESRIEAIGASGIRIVDPDGGRQLTRYPEWYESLSADGVNPRHTDGLAMWAVRKLRTKMAGPGVHFGEGV